METPGPWMFTKESCRHRVQPAPRGGFTSCRQQSWVLQAAQAVKVQITAPERMDMELQNLVFSQMGFYAFISLFLECKCLFCVIVYRKYVIYVLTFLRVEEKYMGIFPNSLYTTCIQNTWRPEEVVRYPGTEVIGGCDLPCYC